MCGFISIILLIELDWKCMLLPGVNRAFLHLCWVGMTLNGFSMKTFLLLQIWCDFCAVGQKHQKKWAAGNYVAVLNKWKTHLQKNNKKLGAFVRLFTRGTMRYWFTYEKGKCTTLHVTCFTKKNMLQIAVLITLLSFSYIINVVLCLRAATSNNNHWQIT